MTPDLMSSLSCTVPPQLCRTDSSELVQDPRTWIQHRLGIHSITEYSGYLQPFAIKNKCVDYSFTFEEFSRLCLQVWKFLFVKLFSKVAEPIPIPTDSAYEFWGLEILTNKWPIL